MPPGNLFANASPPPQGERFESLLEHRNLLVERIVSSSSITPTQYVQSQDEWVVLLQGHATLLMGEVRHELHAGDYLFLPAGVPHTVEQVSQGALWLAVHLHPVPPADNISAHSPSAVGTVATKRLSDV
jgi:cupin 2 domain-containing protein